MRALRWLGAKALTFTFITVVGWVLGFLAMPWTGGMS